MARQNRYPETEVEPVFKYAQKTWTDGGRDGRESVYESQLQKNAASFSFADLISIYRGHDIANPVNGEGAV